MQSESCTVEHFRTGRKKIDESLRHRHTEKSTLLTLHANQSNYIALEVRLLAACNNDSYIYYRTPLIKTKEKEYNFKRLDRHFLFLSEVLS